MSYATLLEAEGIRSEYLAVISPRKILTGFEVSSGSVYSLSFDLGYITTIEQDGTTLAEGSSSALSEGQFYYDPDNQILYVRTSDSSDPATKTVVCTFELFVGTFDGHWYRDPLDSASYPVYYDPVIARSPSIKENISESIFGYLPVISTSIELNNYDHFYERVVYDCSFNKAEIKIYHWLDELTVSNTKLVLKGYTSDVSYDEGSIIIKIFNRIDVFNNEFRSNSTGFFNATDFPNINPNSLGAPIPYVYGKVDGVGAINISYVQEAPTTSDNRNWIVASGTSNIHSLSVLVAASPSSTTTRTYLASAVGFQIGDQVWFVDSSEYKVVTAVNYASKYIEHDALGGGESAGNEVRRSFIGNVTILHNGVFYTPMYGRDWDQETGFNASCIGLTFETSLESNLSFPVGEVLQPSDKVFCRVYGKKNSVQLNSTTFGSNHSEIGNLTNGVGILIDILKSQVGIDESDIDIPTFVSLVASIDDALGIEVVEGFSYPTNKDLISQILQTLLLRLYINDDLKWSASVMAPISSSDDEIDNLEILKNSFNYDFSYDELASEVVVKYNRKSNTNNSDALGATFNYASKTNINASYLHKVKKTKTFETLHIIQSEAETYAQRMAYYFGERIGKASFRTKNRFFDAEINNDIKVKRERLPGFQYTPGTERERILSVVETTKGLREITIVLDDQKGIQDNSGSW